MPDEFPISQNGAINRFSRLIGITEPRTRALVLAVLTWLPLAISTAVQDKSNGALARQFLIDVSVYARFLVVIPLLVMTESIVDARLSAVIRYFQSSGVLDPEESPLFERIRRLILYVVNSTAPTVALIIAAYATSLLIPNAANKSGISAVRSSFSSSWYYLVSLPIYNFILYQWLWRWIMWSLLLWRISRMRLNLIATHPDLAGGLGFVSVGHMAFWYLVLAGGITLSSTAAQRIMFANQNLADFESVMITYIIAVPLLIISPLLAFSRKLLRAKVDGLLRYGALADEYMQGFDEKWAQGKPREETLIGTSDIQSLADMGNSYEVVRKMRIFPFSLSLLIAFIIVAAIPLIPLVFTILPAAEVIARLYKILF